MAATMAKVSCVCGRKCLNLPHNLFSRSLSSVVTHSSQQTNPELPIPNKPVSVKIPRRKKRDSLSILKALADTVERDETSPQYKYVDDPYLHPVGRVDMKSFALSKASGQRAAQYVIQTYPHLFEPSKVEPRIEAFQPKAGAYTHDENTEAGLVERIYRRQTTAAYDSFQKIREGDVSLSLSTYNDLLDLLCAYNSADPLPSLMMDELFFKRDAQAEVPKERLTWQEGCIAEIVFADMEEKNARAYNSMVRGMAKYSGRTKAEEMYQDMKDKGIPVELGTYNQLLRSLIGENMSSYTKWKSAEGILFDLRDSAVNPDLATFNAVLLMLARMDRSKHSPVRALSVIKEMQKLGIEPSLASWTSVVRLFYTDNESQHGILYEVMDHMKGREYTLHESTDYDFFVTAMAKCSINLKDLSLAHKVNDLLNTENNIQFLGDSAVSNLYYSKYLQLMGTFAELSSVIEYYEKVVPHLWVPNYTDVVELLKIIELNEGYYYLPQIWSDILMFRYSNSTEIVECMVQIMANTKHEEELQKKFAAVTDSIMDTFTGEVEMPSVLRQVSLSGSLLGNMAMINLNAGNLKTAWDCFTMYNKKKKILQGFPSENALNTLTRKCMQEGWIKEAIMSVSLMADLAYPTTDVLISELAQCQDLTDSQRNEIAKL